MPKHKDIKDQAVLVQRRSKEDYRWEGVDHLDYKEEGAAIFKDISRQVLFSDAGFDGELRYFEMAPGGYSTLERHEHMHGVMIFRGRGQCLVGNEVFAVKERDLITIPAWAWHQFKAVSDEPLGFLCLVNTTRDRPQQPTEKELQILREDEKIAAFLDC